MGGILNNDHKTLKTHILFPRTCMFGFSWSRMYEVSSLLLLSWGSPVSRLLGVSTVSLGFASVACALQGCSAPSPLQRSERCPRGVTLAPGMGTLEDVPSAHFCCLHLSWVEALQGWVIPDTVLWVADTRDMVKADKSVTVADSRMFSKSDPWLFPETAFALQNFLMCCLRKLSCRIASAPWFYLSYLFCSSWFYLCLAEAWGYNGTQVECDGEINYKS